MLRSKPHFELAVILEDVFPETLQSRWKLAACDSLQVWEKQSWYVNASLIRLPTEASAVVTARTACVLSVFKFTLLHKISAYIRYLPKYILTYRSTHLLTYLCTFCCGVQSDRFALHVPTKTSNQVQVKVSTRKGLIIDLDNCSLQALSTRYDPYLPRGIWDQSAPACLDSSKFWDECMVEVSNLSLRDPEITDQVRKSWPSIPPTCIPPR